MTDTQSAPMGEQELVALADLIVEALLGKKFDGTPSTGLISAMLPSTARGRILPALRAAASPRLAGREAIERVMDLYADSYRRMAKDGDGKVHCNSVEADLLNNIKPGILYLLGNAHSESVGCETEASINSWINSTFGKATSLRTAQRANEEMVELLTALEADESHPKAVEEAADIVIILYRLAANFGVSLHDAINRKMAVNRRREWKIDPDGCGYHVTPSHPSQTSQTAEKTGGAE